MSTLAALPITTMQWPLEKSNIRSCVHSLSADVTRVPFFTLDFCLVFDCSRRSGSNERQIGDLWLVGNTFQ